MNRWSIALSLLTLLGPSAYAHPKPAQEARSDDTVHVVRPGESLSVIARRYGVNAKALAEANRLARPYRLRVGQKLVIPGKTDLRAGGESSPPPPPAPPASYVLEKPSFNGLAPAFIWPVEGYVSSEFGRRRRGWHAGIDIRADAGTPIFAAAAGTVYYSGWERRYGLVVKIQHAENFVTVYAHNLQMFVDVGDEVDQGQVIATVGRTGRATAYHLHFEVQNNGKVYNPLHFLAEREVSAGPEADTQPEDDDENGE